MGEQTDADGVATSLELEERQQVVVMQNKPVTTDEASGSGCRSGKASDEAYADYVARNRQPEAYGELVIAGEKAVTPGEA